MKELCYATAAVLAVSIMCGTSLYGCVDSNQRYYDAMNKCVTGGGSAIPQGNATILCIHR